MSPSNNWYGNVAIAKDLGGVRGIRGGARSIALGWRGRPGLPRDQGADRGCAEVGSLARGYWISLQGSLGLEASGRFWCAG